VLHDPLLVFLSFSGRLSFLKSQKTGPTFLGSWCYSRMFVLYVIVLVLNATSSEQSFFIIPTNRLRHKPFCTQLR